MFCMMNRHSLHIDKRLQKPTELNEQRDIKFNVLHGKMGRLLKRIHQPQAHRMHSLGQGAWRTWWKICGLCGWLKGTDFANSLFRAIYLSRERCSVAEPVTVLLQGAWGVGVCVAKKAVYMWATLLARLIYIHCNRPVWVPFRNFNLCIFFFLITY